MLVKIEIVIDSDIWYFVGW